MTWKDFGIEEIKRICATNNFSDILCQEAISIYKNLKKEEKRHGDTLACVFLACKKNKINKTLDDIESNAFPYDSKIDSTVFKINKGKRIKRARSRTCQ